MKSLLNNHSWIAVSMIVALGLGGCVTTQGPTKLDKLSGARVCDKVEEPARTKLSVVTYHQLPPGTTGPGGIALVAGLTADGVADNTSNMQKLKEREQKWQVRAEAVNKCLDDAAKDAIAASKK